MADKNEFTVPKATKDAQSASKKDNSSAIKSIEEKIKEYLNKKDEFDGIEPPKRTVTPEEDELITITARSGGMEDLDYNGGLDDTFKKRAKENIGGKDGEDNKIFLKRAEIKNKIQKKALELQGKYPVGKVDISSNGIYSESVKMIKEILDGYVLEGENDDDFSKRIEVIDEPTSEDKEKLKFLASQFAMLIPEGETTSLGDLAQSINTQYGENPQVAEVISILNKFRNIYSVTKNGRSIKLSKVSGMGMFGEEKSPYPEDREFDSEIEPLSPNEDEYVREGKDWRHSKDDDKKSGKKDKEVQIKKERETKKQLVGEEVENVEEGKDWRHDKESDSKKNNKKTKEADIKKSRETKKQLVGEEVDTDTTQKVIDSAGEGNQVVVTKDEQTGKDKIEISDKDTSGINESIKQLNFSREGFSFKDEDHAKSLIPESYRVNGKIFNMTDGNQTFTFKWEKESFINEAITLEYTNKQMINENRDKVFHLMGYKTPKTSLDNNKRNKEKDVFVELFQKLNNEE